MKKSELITSCIATALIAAFMVISPGFILKSRCELTLRESRQHSEGFQGVISVWHVVGFKPYQGSLSAWLGKRAAEVEKKRAGVFFELEGITVEECERRFARGEHADVYSFPLGFAYAEQLTPLEYELPELRGNLAGAGDYGGRLFAVPYAASGYIIAANTRLMQEAGIKEKDMPEHIKNGGWRVAGNVTAAAMFGAKGAVAAETDFIEERAEAAFIDARAVGDMARRIQAGKGFPLCEAEFGNYSDLVQFIGVSRKAEEEKIDCMLEFIDAVLAVEAQVSLYELGMVAASLDAEVEKPENKTAELLVHELEDIAAPNTFLYKTYKDQLALSAKELTEGRAEAKKDFELRLIELVRGAVIK